MKTYKIIAAAAIVAANLSAGGIASAITNLPAASDRNTTLGISPVDPSSETTSDITPPVADPGRLKNGVGAPGMNVQGKFIPAGTADGNQNSETTIENRIATMEKVIARIKSMEKLSDDKKEAIIKQIEESIAKFTEMKNELSAGKEPATGSNSKVSDASINFIYPAGVPQAFAMGAIERINTIATAFEALADKLQTLIEKAGSEGANTYQMENDLKSMNSDIAQTRGLAQSAENIISGLGAEDENNGKNREKILEASGYIKTAGEKLRSARETANRITVALKNIAGNSVPK